jgi:hypothetical protein
MNNLSEAGKSLDENISNAGRLTRNFRSSPESTPLVTYFKFTSHRDLGKMDIRLIASGNLLYVFCSRPPNANTVYEVYDPNP